MAGRIIEVWGPDGKPAKSLPHTFWQRPTRKDLDDRIERDAIILEVLPDFKDEIEALTDLQRMPIEDFNKVIARYRELEEE